MKNYLPTPLLELGRRLLGDSQWNDHHTAEPLFCLQLLHRETGYASDYSSNRCWWNAEQGETVFDDDDDERKAALGFSKDAEGWEGPFGYKDQWHTVMVALTSKGLDDYMKEDGHNVRRRAFRGRTRVYVESLRRCQEMIDLRSSLMHMVTAAQGPEAGGWEGWSRSEIAEELRSRLTHLYKQTDGSMRFPSSAEGDLLKMVHLLLDNPEGEGSPDATQRTAAPSSRREIADKRLKRRIERRDRKIAGLERKIQRLEKSLAWRTIDLARLTGNLRQEVVAALGSVRMTPVLGTSKRKITIEHGSDE